MTVNEGQVCRLLQLHHLTSMDVNGYTVQELFDVFSMHSFIANAIQNFQLCIPSSQLKNYILTFNFSNYILIPI